MTGQRIVFITGANRGIGFAICQALAAQSPLDHYILGCRSVTRGQDAISELRAAGIESPMTVVELDVALTYRSKKLSIKYSLNSAGWTYW